MATITEEATPMADVGITILSDPQDAVIDVVFVHGLQGHPRNTWTYKSTSTSSPPPKSSNSSERKTRRLLGIFSKHTRSKSGELKETGVNQIDSKGEGEAEAEAEAINIYWPKDLLAADFPRARIMTFGHNTKVTKGYQPANQGNIFSHARDLLYGLSAKRRKNVDRDLVFIAHSLGGILVKEVLRRSEVDPDPNINKIFTSTSGILFFGTPHRGSKDWASFGEGLAGVAGWLLGVDKNDQVVHALLPTGPELELCRESFTTQWVKRGNSLVVRTFQESKGVVGVGWGNLNQLIVPPDSSSLDHPNQRARTIDENHIGMVKFRGQHDKAYEMVKEELEELVEIIMQAGPNTEPSAKKLHSSVHYLPLKKNHRFVGRSRVLQDLETKLLIKKECPKMALVGLGGIGKTQVALEFAQSVRRNWPEYSVFWVPATSLESFEQACAEIVRTLQIPRATGDNEDVKELVRRYLSDQAAGKWLLVVDNADDMKVLFGTKTSNGAVVDFLPENENGAILFTSRRQEAAESVVGNDIIELGKMSEEEAVAFMKASLRKEAADDATKELAAELDYLPLAIAQAVAYINTNKITIPRYLELLQKTDADLIAIMSREFQDSTRYRRAANAVATTWVVSFNQISEEDAAAADLLAFISCIEWKGIPQSILPTIQLEARMVAAIGIICSYSFMVERDSGNVYDMHRLVHLATRIWLDQAGRKLQAREKAVKHMARVFPTEKYENRAVWRQYLPHTSRLVLTDQADSTEEQQSKLCLKVGRCLYVDGRIKEAVLWLEKSLQWRERHLNEDHPHRLTAQYELAGAYEANGQIKEAVLLLEHVVAIQEKVLAEDHPSRLASQHELAGAYKANGQIKEAVLLLEHVVAIGEKVLAEDHPDRLASQHELAGAYEANGQIKEAVLLLEHVVARGEKALAEDHPSQLASQHALAGAYKANGQVKEAVSLLEYVVMIKKKIFVESHPSRIVSEEALRYYVQNSQHLR